MAEFAKAGATAEAGSSSAASAAAGKALTMDEVEAAKTIAATISYYPFKGIARFYDIGGMLAQPAAFQLAIDMFVQRYRSKDIDSIAGFDARGFILGPPIALALKKPFIMLRKGGKMPNAVSGTAYKKEYKGDSKAGDDVLCVQAGSVKKGDRVLLVDDLVATGGTLVAGVELVTLFGGTVVECACMIELGFLKGRDKVQAKYPDVDVWSLIPEDMLTKAGVAVEGAHPGEAH